MSAITSAASASATGTLLTTSWWFKVVLDDTYDIAADVVSFDPSEHQVAGVFYPRGSDLAVVHSGDIHGDEGPVIVRAWDRATADALEAMFRLQVTLLIQDVLGRQWYVRRVGPRPRRQVKAMPRPSETTPVRHAFEYTLPVVEVTAPA